MKLSLNNIKMELQKKSPEIFLVTGIAGVICGTVVACKATTKLSKIIEERDQKLSEVDQVVNSDEFGDQYTVEDAKKDTMIIHTKTALEIVKLYLPAALIFVPSIWLIAQSHNIVKGRNASLASALAISIREFNEYRNRVEDRYGEDTEYELYKDVRKQKIDEMIVDAETGKEKKVKKEVLVAQNPRRTSSYGRAFDVFHPNWRKDPYINKQMLVAQQAYANDLLKANGYVFLNDIYKLLGFEKTQAGQVIGWVYDETGKNGSSYIDFNMHDDIYYSETNENSETVYNRCILLDFNVDGNILDRVPLRKV